MTSAAIYSCGCTETTTYHFCGHHVTITDRCTDNLQQFSLAPKSKVSAHTTDMVITSSSEPCLNCFTTETGLDQDLELEFLGELSPVEDIDLPLLDSPLPRFILNGNASSSGEIIDLDTELEAAAELLQPVKYDPDAPGNAVRETKSWYKSHAPKHISPAMKYNPKVSGKAVNIHGQVQISANRRSTGLDAVRRLLASLTINTSGLPHSPLKSSPASERPTTGSKRYNEAHSVLMSPDAEFAEFLTSGTAHKWRPRAAREVSFDLPIQRPDTPHLRSVNSEVTQTVDPEKPLPQLPGEYRSNSHSYASIAPPTRPHRPRGLTLDIPMTAPIKPGPPAHMFANGRIPTAHTRNPAKKSLLARAKDFAGRLTQSLATTIFTRRGIDGRALPSRTGPRLNRISRSISRRLTKEGRFELKADTLRRKTLGRKYAEPGYFTIVTSDEFEEASPGS